MRRARKSGKKNSLYIEKTRSEGAAETNINLNAEDKKDFQMKYYGKVIEEPEEEIAEAESVHEEKEETVEETVKQEETESEEVISEADKEEFTEAEENNMQSSVLQEMHRNNAKKNSRKKYIVILAVSLAVMVIASLFVMGIGGFFDFGESEYLTEQVKPVNEITGKVNVLILGVDKEGLRTDTIIAASFDTDDNTVNMLSIPRDTRMYIGSGYKKINSAHAISNKNGKIKGAEGTIDAVTRLTGIPINYYVEFSFEAFRETIDALGGVHFNVPQRMKYSDPVQDLYINLSPGYQLLDGDKAEQLVRFRQYPQGDIKRVEVQQEFIRAVAEQHLNSGIIGKLPELYKTLTKNVKTNFKLSDMTKYAESLLNLNLENIVMHQLPGEYSGPEYSASYWLPDMKETKLLVHNTFGYDTQYITNAKPLNNAVYGEPAEGLLTPEQVPDNVSERPAVSSASKASNDDRSETSAPKSSSKAVSGTDSSAEDDENNKTTASPKPKKTSAAAKSTESPSPEGTAEAVEKTSEPIAEQPSETVSVPEPEPEPVSTPKPVETVAPLKDPTAKDDFVRPGAN